MQLIRVKPRDGLLVRNHDRGHRPLAAEGEEVPDSIEWRRKINAGEVDLIGPAESAPAAAKKSKT